MNDILRKMQQPFTNPSSTNVIVEPLDFHLHILSYRYCDFVGLFSWLQSSLPQEQNINKLFNKFVRESKRKTTKAVMMKEFQEQQFNYFRNEFNIKIGLYAV